MVDDLPALWLWEKFYPIAVRDGLSAFPRARCTLKVFWMWAGRCSSASPGNASTNYGGVKIQ